jgi:hypothetical protein
MGMIDFALQYVADGFKVFPVKLDKTPLTPHGLKDATQTQQGVREYWNKHPDAGIGLVTDGLVVIDFDLKSGGIESKEKIEDKYGLLPRTRAHITGGGGYHYLYKNPNGTHIRNTTMLAGYPGVDIRANGGYIVAPPSHHTSGTDYSVMDESPIIDAPSWLVELTKQKPATATAITTDQPIPQGQRDATLASLAGTMRKRGMTVEEIEAALMVTNKRCQPPLPDKDIHRIANSMGKYEQGQISQTSRPPSAPYMPTISQAKALSWIEMTYGNFNVRQMWSELTIIREEDKAHLRKILQRLVESAVIAKTATDGTYRRIENERKPIDWQNADITNYVPLMLPFGLHNLCRVYPKSIIIVAGSKNEGKTSFLLQCLMPNTAPECFGPGKVDLYNSETGPEQLKGRLSPLFIPKPAPFNVYERYDNFADVIDPTHLSVIDYLDMNAEVYLVGQEIDNIFRKLTTGVVIIGLQKPAPSTSTFKGVTKTIDRDLAYGGSFSAKRAVIYVSMSNHKLKLVYVKTPANPKVNPNNKTWTYDFDDTGFFTNIKEYWGENEPE